MTENPNPYATPLTQTQPIARSPAQDNQGLWREGNLLVMHKNARLRDTCVKTGEPASHSVKRKVTWHPPWIIVTILLGILIYAFLAIIMTKRAKLSFPLSEAAYRNRRSWLMRTWLAGLLCIAAIVGGFFLLVGEVSDALGVSLLIGGFVGGIVCLIVGQNTARILKPTKITDSHVWLKGVHENLLKQCPTFDS